VLEAGLEAVHKVRQRLQAADTDEAVERMVRSLQTAGRYVRQTIAMKQRFDRDQARLMVELRKAAEVARQEDERARTASVAKHRARARRHLWDVLWNEHEYEQDDAYEIFRDVGAALDKLAIDDDAFPDTPVATLVARLLAEFDLPSPADLAALPDDVDDDDDDDEYEREPRYARALPATGPDPP